MHVKMNIVSRFLGWSPGACMCVYTWQSPSCILTITVARLITGPINSTWYNIQIECYSQQIYIKRTGLSFFDMTTVTGSIQKAI